MDKQGGSKQSVRLKDYHAELFMQGDTKGKEEKPQITIAQIRQNLPPDSIVIGEKFLVGRTLGEGSFGQIQLGTNIETGDFVAIKIV